MHKLIYPNQKYFESFIKACDEWKQNGVTMDFLNRTENLSPAEILKKFDNERKGINLQPGYVPCSHFWLVDGREFVGCGDLRHHLTGNLEKFGGHIGYAIRPSKWNRGLGTLQLKLLLRKAAELGIKYALLTCNEENKKSAAVMKKNGGRFFDQLTQEVEGKTVNTLRCLINTRLPIHKWKDKRFSFRNVPRISGEEVDLVILEYAEEIREKKYCPAYIFNIVHSGSNTKIGSIDLRIGKNEEIFYGGNIGYRIEEPYRGNHYAGKACKLLYPLALSHGLKNIEITCDPENLPSAKTCEWLGFKYLEYVTIPKNNDQYALGQRYKRRYVMDIAP